MSGYAEDLQQIDIWCNEDGVYYADEMIKRLERLTDFPVIRHDIDLLISHPELYNEPQGTIVVIITEDTLQLLQREPSLCFNRLNSAKYKRFYVAENYARELQRDDRFKLIGREPVRTWGPISGPNQYSEITTNTLQCEPTSTLGRRVTGGKSTNGIHKGAFKVIPNRFVAGSEYKDLKELTPIVHEGTIIIDQSLLRRYNGTSVTAYLVDRNDKTGGNIDIELNCEDVEATKPVTFTFRLPAKLKPSRYMIHVRDGDAAIGNRSITIMSELPFICDNLFSDACLSSLGGVENMSTRANCDIADEKLCSLYDAGQLPVKLPHILGKDFPTLLHVAAWHGLTKLFVKLTETFKPLDDIGLLKSTNGHTPSELAKQNGHDKLAECLENQLEIDDMYVTCAPNKDADFDDMYDLPGAGTGNSAYVRNAMTANIEEEDDGIYTIADGNGSSSTTRRAVSYKLPDITDRPKLAQAPATLPRSHRYKSAKPEPDLLFRAGSLFQRDVPEDAIVPDDPALMHAQESKQIIASLVSGEITPELAEAHVFDWTRRIKSIRKLETLDEKLKCQKELRYDMEKGKKALIKNPRFIGPEVGEAPPPVVPRGEATFKTKTPISQRPAKEIVAPPPLLPRQTSYDNKKNIAENSATDSDSSDYLEPVSIGKPNNVIRKPQPPPPPVKPRKN